MNNINAPKIPSGPSSSLANGSSSDGLVSIADLQRRKDDMEAELRALSHVLDSHGVNMETPLVTRDGFPRSDIGVAQVRTTRHKIICLRNDYKVLMNQIEKCVHEIFANNMNHNENDNDNDHPTESNGNSKNGLSTSSNSNGMDQQQPLRDYVAEELPVPFAKVNSVSDGSPAADAGLKSGDLIRNFGYVNARNHDGLNKVAECVQGNENHDITVKVTRRSELGSQQELSLTLKPRRDWGGRGMLGCHILAIN